MTRMHDSRAHLLDTPLIWLVRKRSLRVLRNRPTIGPLTRLSRERRSAGMTLEVTQRSVVVKPPATSKGIRRRRRRLSAKDDERPFDIAPIATVESDKSKTRRCLDPGSLARTSSQSSAARISPALMWSAALHVVAKKSHQRQFPMRSALALSGGSQPFSSFLRSGAAAPALPRGLQRMPSEPQRAAAGPSRGLLRRCRPPSPLGRLARPRGDARAK